MSSLFAAASPLGFVGRWSARSQEQARRNAMAACTVLTARRLERLEVAEYVAAHLARHEQSVAAAAPEVAPAVVVPIRQVS